MKARWRVGVNSRHLFGVEKFSDTVGEFNLGALVAAEGATDVALSKAWARLFQGLAASAGTLT